MIDVTIEGGDPHLAELIASTLPGHPLSDPSSSAAHAGRFVREQQEEAEVTRPSREQIATVNFALIDDEMDWTDV
jgi:hypothetical protein